MKLDSFKILSVSIPVVIASHYYLSYQFLSKMLEQYGLLRSGIITLQDLLFQFADLNQSILLMVSLGFSMILLVRLLSSTETYNSFDTIVLNNFKDSIRNVKAFFLNDGARAIKVVLVILTLIGISIIGYGVVKASLDKNFTPLVQIFLVSFFVVPFAYIFFVSKRIEIFIISLFVLLMFSNLLIKNALSNHNLERQKGEFVQISFEYKNRKIVSSDTLFPVYNGYKYLVMRNPIAEETFLFEKNLMTEIKIKNKAELLTTD